MDYGGRCEETAYIAPGSPWENGFINARLRDELLDGEIRAGLGNLNNLDKWKFCLNAA